jgi:hypothetical protein
MLDAIKLRINNYIVKQNFGTGALHARDVAYVTIIIRKYLSQSKLVLTAAVIVALCERVVKLGWLAHSAGSAFGDAIVAVGSGADVAAALPSRPHHHEPTKSDRRSHNGDQHGSDKPAPPAPPSTGHVAVGVVGAVGVVATPKKSLDCWNVEDERIPSGTWMNSVVEEVLWPR